VSAPLGRICIQILSTGLSCCVIPAFERLHYEFGFHTPSFSGGGQESRAALFAAFASGPFDLPMREAWAEANEIVEGGDVVWAYRRTTSPDANTYHERLRADEPAESAPGRDVFIARGTC
jgi:Family of unknown function (DUF6345)